MKKALSFVLAGALAAGMSTAAFASLGSNTIAKITGFEENKSLIDGYVYRGQGDQYTNQSNLRSVALGTIYAQDEVEDIINLKASMFKGASNIAGINQYTGKVYSYLNPEFATSTKFFHKPQTTVSSWPNHTNTMVQAITTPYALELDGKLYTTLSDVQAIVGNANAGNVQAVDHVEDLGISQSSTATSSGVEITAAGTVLAVTTAFSAVQALNISGTVTMTWDEHAGNWILTSSVGATDPTNALTYNVPSVTFASGTNRATDLSAIEITVGEVSGAGDVTVTMATGMNQFDLNTVMRTLQDGAQITLDFTAAYTANTAGSATSASLTNVSLTNGRAPGVAGKPFANADTWEKVAAVADTMKNAQVIAVARDNGTNIKWIPGESKADAETRLMSMDLIRPLNLTTTKYADWFAKYQNAGMMKEDASKTINNVVYFMNANGEYRLADPVNLDDITSERNLSSEEIRENNIAVYTSLQEESRALKKVELLRSEGRIKIEWATRFVSVDDKNFALTLALSFDGRRDDNRALTFTGKIDNKRIKVYGNTNSVNIEEGLIVVPTEFNSKIAVYVGNGATIHTKFFKDKKYYCTTDRDADEADDVVFKKYADVDNVLTFYNVGINNTGDYVTLSTDYADYYVYDKDMKYLGRGNEQLNYSQKLYLANKRLDVDTEEETETPTETDKETPVEKGPNPPTGGDSGKASSNANNNPGTGR